MQVTSDYQPESFDEWFAKMQRHPELMSLVHQIYQYDQLGKINNQTLIISLKVRHRAFNNVIGGKIESLSRFMELGMLDDLIALRKKNGRA